MYAIREIKGGSLVETFTGKEVIVMLFKYRKSANLFYRNVYKPDGTFGKRTHEVVPVTITEKGE